MTILSFIFQAAAAPAAGTSTSAGGGGLMMNLIMIGLIIFVFYFFMMRPQMKKQKEQRSFVEELNKGSKVVTIGGIVGKIVDVTEKTFWVECKTGAKVEVLRTAISLENSRLLNLQDKDADSKAKKEVEEKVS